MAMQGDAAAGVTHLQAGFEAQRTGHKLYRPIFSACWRRRLARLGSRRPGWRS